MNFEPLKNMLLVLLGSVGGWLINKGWITAELWTQAVAAIVAVATFLYAYWKGRTVQVVAAAARLDEVKNIEVTTKTLADKLGPNVSKA